MPNYRRVYKQGNSLVISFPEWMLDQIGVKRKDMVLVEVQPGKSVTIYPAQREAFPKGEKNGQKGS